MTTERKNERAKEITNERQTAKYRNKERTKK